MSIVIKGFTSYDDLKLIIYMYFNIQMLYLDCLSNGNLEKHVDG